MLHELVPSAAVIAMLLNPNNANAELERNETEVAARALGLQLVVLRANTEREIDAAIANLVQQRAAALYLSGDGYFNSRRDQIVALAARHAIPTSGPNREQVVAGMLMSYGANRQDSFRQFGSYVARVLKGEKPADLPVMQPTKFQFVLNLKTAKALGLTIPNAMQLLADEVIE